MSKNFVWISTDESIEKKQLSIAACVEIALSIALYWAIWYWLDTHLHLIFSLIVAPILLLRSPESIRKGVELYNRGIEVNLNSIVGMLLVLVGASVGFAAGWVVANAWLLGHEGFSLFWRSAVIVVPAIAVSVAVAYGVTIAITGHKALDEMYNTLGEGIILAASAGAILGEFAGAGVNAGAGAIVSAGVLSTAYIVAPSPKINVDLSAFIVTLMMPVAAIVVGISLVLSTLIIRLIATLIFLIAGIRCLAENWSENMFAIDPWHPPNLLPKEESLSLDKSILGIDSGDAMEIAFFIFLVPIAYAPALLYRWSIKSTFWFYWPILYVGSERFNRVEDKHAFSVTLIKHPWEIVRLILAISTLFVLGYIAISGDKIVDIQSTNPAMIFPYMLAIDVYMIKPWQWLQLATAILTLILWFRAWTVLIQLQTAEKYGREYDWKPLVIMQIVSRLRNLSTWGYLAIAIIFTTLYWEDVYTYLPSSWIEWLAAFYDTELPIRLGGS